MLTHGAVYQQQPGVRRPKYILVIVDYTTRLVLLIPMVEKNSLAVITALKANIYKFYGVPSEIVIDEDSVFTSHEMRRHFEEYDIYPDFVSTENHRSNGLAEVTVRIVHDYFKKLKPQEMHKWRGYVPEIQRTINDSPLSSMGRTSEGY